jgi:UDP-glucose 4-epimerase
LIGEDPNGIPNNLMPFIMQVGSGKLPELSIFGNDYDTRDGTGERDYIHVLDLADGHLAALTYLQDHCGCEVFNLGTGNAVSVLELIHSYEQAGGGKIPVKIAPRREGDLAICYADASKAKKLLSWQAKRGVAEMCSSGLRWQKYRSNQGNRFE